jgi:hypothetical protein
MLSVGMLLNPVSNYQIIVAVFYSMAEGAVMSEPFSAVNREKSRELSHP